MTNNIIDQLTRLKEELIKENYVLLKVYLPVSYINTDCNIKSIFTTSEIFSKNDKITAITYLYPNNEEKNIITKLCKRIFNDKEGFIKGRLQDPYFNDDESNVTLIFVIEQEILIEKSRRKSYE